MSKQVSRIAAVAFCAALLMAGCAKQEMVKKDEGIAPAQAKAAPQQTAAKQEPQNVAVKEQPVRQEPVKETASQQAADASSLAALKAELQTIYFDFDASTLTDAARSSLAKNAEVLKKNATAKIQIAGNCDERGSDEYNLALGEKRAQAAKKYLVTMGVAAERLTTISYGKEKPADPGHNEAAWAKNRRDDFDVLSR
ncbi:peptidoglycan-associated lipoprotein Pal [Geobacter sp.]|uniref:peptidoglycan-associated lipoprotein Pal n=1 Tax=Geobacter sp. TaxID=46610 RepID=UPI0026288014|nr:peptidoglycan-associated lipoprotein Pal [Geobacter sp.]